MLLYFKCRGYSLSLLALFMFWGMILLGIGKAGFFRFIKTSSRLQILLWVCMSLIYFLLGVWVISQEKCVYTWDYGNYWYKTVNMQERIYGHLIQALREVYHSINEDDYKSMFSYLVAAPLKFFGNSYMAFVLLIYGLFAIPVVTLLAYFILIICEKELNIHVNYSVIYLFCILIKIVICPVLHGYIDIAALLPILVCYLMVVTKGLDTKDFIRDIMIGILLVTAWLIRRYHIYTVIGFVCWLFLYSLWPENIMGKRKVINLRNKCISILTIGGIAASILLTLFRKFLLRALFNDFATTYEAYNQYSLWIRIGVFGVFWGWLNLALCLIATFMAVKQKELGRAVFPLLCAGIVPVALFNCTQIMGIHHSYTVVIPIIVMAAIVFCSTVQLLYEGSRCRLIVPIGIITYHFYIIVLTFLYLILDLTICRFHMQGSTIMYIRFGQIWRFCIR